MVWIGIGIAVLALSGFLFLLWKLQQGGSQKTLEILATQLGEFQTGLQNLQRESAVTADAKAQSLRTELTQQLHLNRVELQQGLQQTNQVLEQRVRGLDARLEKHLKELSEGVQTKLENTTKEGFRQFEKVQESLKLAEQQLAQLNVVGQSVNDLNNLLKLPHLRGNFGEATLERILEDRLPADCYEFQYRLTPQSTERVDAVIKYPNFVVPIDSKFPREQVLSLFETQEPVALEEARKVLGEVIRTLAKSIKEKYIRPEFGTSEVGMLFVPSETLYFEIIRNAKLCEDLCKLNVFAVSPHTLSIALQAISAARAYYDMAQGVEQTITEVRKARGHFDNFHRKYEDIGSALLKAQAAFNTGSTHLLRYQSATTRLTGTTESELEATIVPSLPS